MIFDICCSVTSVLTYTGGYDKHSYGTKATSVTDSKINQDCSMIIKLLIECISNYKVSLSDEK